MQRKVPPFAAARCLRRATQSALSTTGRALRMDAPADSGGASSRRQAAKAVFDSLVRLQQLTGSSYGPARVRTGMGEVGDAGHVHLMERQPEASLLQQER